MKLKKIINKFFKKKTKKKSKFITFNFSLLIFKNIIPIHGVVQVWNNQLR
jgi:hypothetical protein